MRCVMQEHDEACRRDTKANVEKLGNGLTHDHETISVRRYALCLLLPSHSHSNSICRCSQLRWRRR